VENNSGRMMVESRPIFIANVFKVSLQQKMVELGFMNENFEWFLSHLLGVENFQRMKVNRGKINMMTEEIYENFLQIKKN